MYPCSQHEPTVGGPFKESSRSVSRVSTHTWNRFYNWQQHVWPWSLPSPARSSVVPVVTRSELPRTRHVLSFGSGSTDRSWLGI